MNGEGNAYGYDGGPRAKENGDERAADCVPGGATWQGDVKHHGEEAERGGYAQERHLLARYGLAYLLDGRGPDGNHGNGGDSAGGWAEVILRDMHVHSFPLVKGNRNTKQRFVTPFAAVRPESSPRDVLPHTLAFRF